MAQVSVTIDGKVYRMACDEGQEEHLTDLAGRFDSYVGQLKGSFGEIGDLRLTVMAGIMVVDELTEVQKRIAALEAEMAEIRDSRDVALAKVERNDMAVGQALASVADRIERVTARLAGQPQPG